MPPTAKLFARVNIEWSDWKGRSHDCDVEVDYSYDGDGDIRILGTTDLGHMNCDEHTYDALVFDKVSELADQEYAEWRAELAP